jgi:hypothetical protein
MANTTGFAYLAASMLTRRNVVGVATDYAAWIATKPTLATAENALLAAAGWSKSPTRVLANANEYYAAMENDPPTISTVTPNTGTTAGGTAITLVGTNFNGATAVTVGATAATSVVVVNDTHITCVTPAKTAGAKDVVVTTPAGSGTKTNGFTYS